MTSNGDLAIRYASETHRKPQSLQFQLQQVIAQKGAFRDISEKALDAESDRPRLNAADDAIPSDGAEESDDETPKTRQERLWKERNSMLQRLSYAQNEVLSALDFISLLLSGQSRQAQSSMSPALTAVVAPGTLGSKVMGVSSVSSTGQARLNKVSSGWKCKNFAAAAEKLSAATSRLNTETTRQGRYWQQISHLKDQGWIVSRFPADNRFIGVHIGSAESAPQFRNRGFVMLQQNALGELELDAGVATRRTEPIGFVIRRGNMPTGASMKSLGSQKPSIDAELICARDALFEEELFYEINREARIIANQGVSTRANSVEVKIDDQISLQITTANGSVVTSSSHEDDDLAQYFALSTRLLLFDEHERLHKRRCQSPAVMSSSPLSVPEFTILRRLIANVRHHLHLAKFSRLCTIHARAFEQAGIPITVDVRSHSQLSELPSEYRVPEKPISSINLILGSDRPLSFSISTTLGSPIYGTEFTISAVQFSFAVTKSCIVRDRNEARELLLHVLNLELASAVINIARRISPSKLNWSLSRHSPGEFLINRGTRSIAKAIALVEPNRLTLSIANTTKSAVAVRKVYIWDERSCSLWTPAEKTSLPAKSLEAIMEEVVDDIS